PDVFAAVFPTAASPVFGVLSQIGLILLMFLVGLEFDFGHLRAHGATAWWISIGGIAMPFTIGLLVAALLHPLVGGGINALGFSLFVATAISITALPTLARMMLDFNLHRTRLGTITIMAAALDDVSGWIMLAVVSAIVRSRFNAVDLVWMIAE